MTSNDRDKRIRDDMVRDAYSMLQKKKLSRRDFLRFASVMGASLTAVGLGACQPAATATPQATAQTVATATTVPTAASGIKRGGKLVSTFFFSTERFNDPAIINSYF